MRQLIAENQASSLKRVLEEALSYHYSNLLALEKIGEPFATKDGESIKDYLPRMKANTNIKFEAQAYLSQYRRLKHFIKHYEKLGLIKKPTDPGLKEAWHDLMDEDGVINVFANKWAAHRSADDPRKGDTDSLHLSVLLNLEGAITFWGNGHMYLSFEKYSFCVFDYHPKALNFCKWVFSDLETAE